MKMIQLKCASCGAKLNVKSEDKFVECKYCGCKYAIDDEKIVVEHFIKDEKTVSLYKNADTYLNKLKDYSEAYKAYSKLSKLNPGDKDCWKGIILSLTEKFHIPFDILSYYDCEKIKKAYSNYLALSSSKDDFIKEYEKYTEINKKDEKEKNKNNKLFYVLWFIIPVILVVIALIGNNDNHYYGNNGKSNNEDEFFEKNFRFVKKVKCSAFSKDINSFVILDSSGGGFFVNGKAYELYIDDRSGESCSVVNYYSESNKNPDIGEFVSAGQKYFEDNESYQIYTTKGYSCEYFGSCHNYKHDNYGGVEKDKRFYYELDAISKKLGFSIDDVSKYQVYLNQDPQRISEYYVYYNDKLYITNGYLYSEVDFKFDKDEHIEKLTRYVRTNKAYYEIETYIKNEDECKDNMNVNCENGTRLVLSKTLNPKYDDIYYANYYVITKDGSIYIDKDKYQTIKENMNREPGP